MWEPLPRGARVCSMAVQQDSAALLQVLRTEPRHKSQPPASSQNGTAGRAWNQRHRAELQLCDTRGWLCSLACFRALAGVLWLPGGQGSDVRGTGRHQPFPPCLAPPRAAPLLSVLYIGLPGQVSSGGRKSETKKVWANTDLAQTPCFQ